MSIEKIVEFEEPSPKRFKSSDDEESCCENVCNRQKQLQNVTPARKQKFLYCNEELNVITQVDEFGEPWMVANPFATVLQYYKPNDAVRKHVSEWNVKSYEDFRSRRIGADDSSHWVDEITSSLHPKTKFINRAGLFELIQSSRMPKAQEFKNWVNSDLLPKLCQEGEYNMAKDAPVDVALCMNAVRAVTNDGREAPWLKDMECLKTAIVEKDRKIEDLTVALQESNQKLVITTEKLTDANEKLTETNNKLVTLATALVSANEGLIKANTMLNDARVETAQLANRMADVAQDVIAKPSDPQLLHSLAVCSMGGDQYAFLRPQKRSLKRSLNRLSVDDSQILFKSDYVPNSMNVLNKVKENLPKDKFKARHNKITLLEDLTKEDFVEAINSSLTQRQVAIIANKANNTKQ
ncbi:ORF159 [Xestia c-nigrum granulovirus]|uniref:ORF159 n=1 Tax=Xestia c-nigrum granulosis virus TaxID=51677 RepID=Q9PYN7_GVXN|nr:ORF159 [Xestia c-nigrum granulovirus]AAF05273.1 ORF159 [Xestia c-nigrum granulovirus]